MSWLIWYIFPGDQPWREALKYVWGDSSISVNVTISNLFFRSTGISKYQTGSYVFLTNKMFYKMFQWMFLQAVVLNICSRRRKRWWKGWKALALSAHATSVFLPHSISYFWAGWQNLCEIFAQTLKWIPYMSKHHHWNIFAQTRKHHNVFALTLKHWNIFVQTLKSIYQNG